MSSKGCDVTTRSHNLETPLFIGPECEHNRPHIKGTRVIRVIRMRVIRVTREDYTDGKTQNKTTNKGSVKDASEYNMPHRLHATAPVDYTCGPLGHLCPACLKGKENAVACLLGHVTVQGMERARGSRESRQKQT